MRKKECMTSEKKKKGRKTGMFIFICILAFLVSFTGSVIFKMTFKSPALQKYSVDWNDKVGTKYTNLSYGTGNSNKFDLYVPADQSKKTYGLIVYLHAGGFTTGDKSDDASVLEWLCSKGYVTAGINYTLFSKEHPDANVYSQSLEIKEAMPKVVEEAKKLGYNVTEMAVSGGSAGGTLAMLYAYRDADTSPVPVKMMFEAVGPSSFYPEDWGVYGLDKSPAAAVNLFGTMLGSEINPDVFGTDEYDKLIKPISGYMWVNENSVPSVIAYGTHDKVCPFLSAQHLVKALEDSHVTHTYIECPHSGHALQNDNKLYMQFLDTALEYLNTYMPVK